ncbi:MAG: hydrolase [Candidatus Saccharibacteria bacterium]|jgi:ADP-ribose pyrophosphatase YjhB (NUDIX family)|nr:hydrolase [Candidatus Saccharibacteria bacterium]
MVQMAGCVLLDTQSRILLLSRRSPRQLEMPGGPVEVGEDPVISAARYTQESLGVLVTVTGELASHDFQQDGKDYHFKWFMAAIVSGAPQSLNPKYDGHQFFTWDELTHRDDLSPNVKNIVSAVDDGLLAQLQSRHRRTRNEVIIATHNQRTRRLAERVLDNDSKAFMPLSFTCECSDASCSETVPLSVEEYVAAHSRTDYFIIRPGHEQTDIERVVACYPSTGQSRYCVVEKQMIERRTPAV